MSSAGVNLRLIERLRTWWKWSLSFRKSSWELEDYPVTLRKSQQDSKDFFKPPRFKFHPWVASIENWNVHGFGDTREEALKELRVNFVLRKANLMDEGKPMPRPGTYVPIEFTSQERVNAHPELAEDFIHRVLGLDWAWVSDESSLWDFHVEATNDSYLTKVREIYGVNVDDIESARLYEIFDRIAESRKLTTDR